MIVTEEWLRANSTSPKVGSWTDRQFKILGVEKRKGWMDHACGLEISEAERIEFESYGYDKFGDYNREMF
jgi:hypothetical protein